MYTIEVHPEVYNELEIARKWYSEMSADLGNEFLDEIEFAVNAIQTSPEIWPKYQWVSGTRHFLVHRFPFGIFYSVSSKKVTLLGIGHLHRKPGYWKKRM